MPALFLRMLSLGLGGWVVGLSCPLHDGVEPVVLVRGVLHSADGAICIVNTIGSLHHVPISRLPLVFHVPGMGIVYCVVELVLRVSLSK